LLQLFFSAFPGGMPGMSLLLLRAVLGVGLVTEGGFYLRAQPSTLGTWGLGLTAVAAGALLLIGFMTPLAALATALGGAGAAFASVPASGAHVFDSTPAAIFALTMLLAIAGTGPGRFSLDARLFGRREIIIPASRARRPRDCDGED
jgi:uncharacterized membrane protein YphA (DoxX/SURF4 family)